MPKLCEPCQFYSADNAPTACPTCNKPLRFTLLPPRGATPEPLANVAPAANSATSKARRRKEPLFSGFSINPKVGWSIFCAVLAVIGFAARSYQTREQLDQVSVGMHISDAAQLIDTGRGTHHPKMVRFRDRFAPDDTSSGTHSYSDGSNEIKIEWKNGIVTSVERKEGTGGGGTRRARTTITDPGDDDDD